MMGRTESKQAGGAKHSTATTRGKPHSKAARRRRGGPGEEYSLGREIWRIGLNILGILFGLAVLGACLGGWYGARLAVTVLQEIGQRDFAGAYDRLGTYEAFLTALNDSDYDVKQGKTNITEGRERYTWVVQPRGSSELRRFQWVHDYEANEVYALTNPALCLDIELGYVAADAAGDIELAASEKYDPEDLITQAIVKNNFSLIKNQLLNGGEGWDAASPAESAVGAPRISPAAAAGREAAAAAKVVEEEAAEQDGDTPAPEAGEATDLVGGEPPPADPEAE